MLLIASLASLLLATEVLGLPQAAPSASATATTGDRYNSVTFGEGDTLEECSFVEQRWADPSVPKGSEPRDLTYNVTINFQAYTGDPSTHNGNYLVGELDGRRNYSRQVTWPAGTTLEITNEARAFQGGNNYVRWEEKKAYTIGPGRSQDCIPRSAYPIRIDVSKLQNVSSCSTVDLAWRGSEPRYDVNIVTFNTVRSRQPESIQNLTEKTVSWNVLYPPGTQFSVQISGANSSSATVNGFQVGPVVGPNCSIPERNQYAPPLSDAVTSGTASTQTALSSARLLAFGIAFMTLL